jgi:hypothetical protein
MGMRYDSAAHRPPRIDVKFAGRAEQAVGGGYDQIFG